ncbi:hypothetical protein [Streptomyces sp. NPDC048639]|uniref:hypothetical protein n=1 Tax=Streptomyces sp. NPDC048639 TaxID=3365581 RepID=UPI00371B9404
MRTAPATDRARADTSDPYCDRHQERMNGDPRQVVTEHDAWNDENFSVVKGAPGAATFNNDPGDIMRAYPRYTKGDLMNFTYDDLSRDYGDETLNWYEISPGETGHHYVNDKRFSLVSWRGRHSDGPTEVYLPPGFDPAATAVVTDRTTQYGFTVRNASANTPDEVMIADDPHTTHSSAAGRGHRLVVFDDQGERPGNDAEDDTDTWHYALVVADPDAADTARLQDIRAELNAAVQGDPSHGRQPTNPVQLVGKLNE